MTTINTKDLTGAALDWAVAVSMGLQPLALQGAVALPLINGKTIERPVPGLQIVKIDQSTFQSLGWEFRPSAYWAQGGPIMEPAHMAIHRNELRDKSRRVRDGQEWIAICHGAHGVGPTMLIAAMRAFVASKLGDTLGIPPELAA